MKAFAYFKSTEECYRNLQCVYVEMTSLVFEHRVPSLLFFIFSSVEFHYVVLSRLYPRASPHFDRINREWITQMFHLESIDESVIGHPQRNIIDKGGFIWFAEHPNFGIVGTCALMKKGEGVFELTKMGVVSEARGLKVGEGLLQHVLSLAPAIAFNTLFLLTNKKCESAIHLYEKNGFVHCEDVMQQFGCAYERCDVAMLFKGATKTG